MIEFILNLKVRNECLFQFGTINFILALFFLGLTKYSNMQLNNISAWFKPLSLHLQLDCTPGQWHGIVFIYPISISYYLIIQ